jgi:hypothetical protein
VSFSSPGAAGLQQIQLLFGDTAMDTRLYQGCIKKMRSSFGGATVGMLRPSPSSSSEGDPGDLRIDLACLTCIRPSPTSTRHSVAHRRKLCQTILML